MLQRQKDNIKILSTYRLIISGFQPCNQVCDINNVVLSIFIIIIFMWISVLWIKVKSTFSKLCKLIANDPTNTVCY